MGTAAAMATVARVADLETMGQKHGLSLNLLSCNNMVLVTISRGFYCYKDHFDTVIDYGDGKCYLSWCSSPLSLLREQIITQDIVQEKLIGMHFTIKVIRLLVVFLAKCLVCLKSQNSKTPPLCVKFLPFTACQRI